MTRMTYGQLAPLAVDELIAAAKAELEAYQHDGERDHLYNAGRAATWAGNRSPKPPRQRVSRQQLTTPTARTPTTAIRFHHIVTK